MRFLVVILLLLSKLSFSDNYTGSLNGSLTINILLGTQLKAINFGISIFGTSSFDSKIALEGGININISPFIQKYGVYQRDLSGTIEVFSLIGWGNNSNLLGSNIGLTRHTAFFDENNTNGSFYGTGLAFILNKITGDLKKFANTQSGLLLRFSNHQNSLTFNISNDVNARPFTKTGSDKGPTARVFVSYSKIENQQLFGLGIGIDMFTPEADYGKSPRSLLNSEEGMRAVLVNTKPYDDLFHFNLFTSIVYQNEDINLDGRFGVDNYKLGALTQNVIHDNFGLYPRFAWPVNKKGRFYSLLDVNTSFNSNFSE